MKIMYVGQLWKGGTCRMRMRALQDLGHEITPVDTWLPSVERLWRGFLPRLLNKLSYPPDLARVNVRIVELVARGHPHIVWVDKGLTIKPATLHQAKTVSPETLLVSYSPDDMANPQNQSRWYLRALPLYDIHFTTKTYNVDELQNLGARQVFFVYQGYDPYTHRPFPLTEKDRHSLGGKVGFIGAFELDRAQHLLALAKAGIPVRVWGGVDWFRWQAKHWNLIVENRPLWGDDYAKAICSFEINLGFLRKINRDQHTSRSIEIPACGAFMLAERTDEHLKLFAEGKEAEFFGSIEELIEKAQFYLKHGDLRKKIAQAGRERCLRSGYDYPSRMRWMLEQVASICAG